MASEDTRHIHGIYTYLQIKLIYIKINESKKILIRSENTYIWIIIM